MCDALFEELSRLLRLKASMVGVDKDTLPAALDAGLFKAAAWRLSQSATGVTLEAENVSKWLAPFNVA